MSIRTPIDPIGLRDDLESDQRLVPKAMEGDAYSSFSEWLSEGLTDLEGRFQHFVTRNSLANCSLANCDCR